MHQFLDLLRSLTDPDKLRTLLTTVFSGWWGYALLFSIVFAETGLLVGFFLPGDSLLFTVGVVAGAGDLNILLIDIALIAAALIGDAVAYQIGHRTGDAIFSRPDSRLFRREYVTQTQEFYEKHGGKTIIYAKFVPIVRTFAPFIAGVARMPYPRFAAFDVFGATGWVISMTVSGYFLGGVPLIRRHFEKVVILIVLVSVLPVILQILRSRKPAQVAATTAK